jgi:hypothetical protein
MTFQPSPRRLDILAAWWQSGMSNVGAGELLNLSPQIIRNELLILRRGAGAKDNSALVQRYRDRLVGRELRQSKRRKVA